MIIEEQAFSLSNDLAPPPSPPPSPVCKRQSGRLRKERQLADGREWGRGQIIRWRESLILYKSLNTLCLYTLLWIQLTPVVDSGIPFWTSTWLGITCSTHRSRHPSQLYLFKFTSIIYSWPFCTSWARQTGRVVEFFRRKWDSCETCVACPWPHFVTTATSCSVNSRIFLLASRTLALWPLILR